MVFDILLTVLAEGANEKDAWTFTDAQAGARKLSKVAFADDLGLLAASAAALQKMLNTVSVWCMLFGMEACAHKSYYLKGEALAHKPTYEEGGADIADGGQEAAAGAEGEGKEDEGGAKHSPYIMTHEGRRQPLQTLAPHETCSV